MLCQTCQKTNATLSVRMNVNGNEKQLHLCQSCFNKEREKLASSLGQNPIGFGLYSFPSFEDIFNQRRKEPQEAVIDQKGPSQQGMGGGLLEKYGRNLTNLARAGLIDPVIGRDDEVNRVIEILNRRNKNNPVLIGEPGVGKTAIAEHLAVQIVTGNVPSKLANKVVILLDVASLVSNTGIRGQFEERMKGLIQELQHNKNIILFIDEIHLLVGAGSAEGSMDAGNILKPALSRGELQLVGATTLKEYRQIEKDAALERRFQPVHIHEPRVEAAIEILKGLKTKYEDYHEVTYTDEALVACVMLSHRYIQDRFLPDKAIDLLDEAGSKLNLTVDTTNSVTMQARLAEIAKAKEEALKLEKYEQAAKLRDEEVTLEKKLQLATRHERPVVDTDLIYKILEKKTGIPVGKLEQSEQQKLKHLEENLAAKVIGQKQAVQKLAKAIRRSRAGLKSKERPIGSFLFVGPTGVGKTELSKTLALELFGSKDAMIRLDMSEFMEKHSVSKLIGSPPGYVGHEEAGQLTEKVRRNPYTIILLDEIEKAHPDVQHLFLQILDDGRLTDSQGRTISFKDTVIIMTSNAGVGLRTIKVGFEKNTSNDSGTLLESLGSYFKPEFLNRFDNIIEFSTLSEDDLVQIVDLMLNDLQTILEDQSIKLTVEPSVKKKLASLGYSPAFGARPLRRVIQEKLEDQISDFIIDQPGQSNLIATLVDDEIFIRTE